MEYIIGIPLLCLVVGGLLSLYSSIITITVASIMAGFAILMGIETIRCNGSGAIGGIILTILLLIGSGMMVVGIYITNVIIVLLG